MYMKLSLSLCLRCFCSSSTSTVQRLTFCFCFSALFFESGVTAWSSISSSSSSPSSPTSSSSSSSSFSSFSLRTSVYWGFFQNVSGGEKAETATCGNRKDPSKAWMNSDPDLNRTVIFAATASRTPRQPAAFVFGDGPAGRCAFFIIRVWIDAAELHNIEEVGEVLGTDPNRDGYSHQSSLFTGLSFMFLLLTRTLRLQRISPRSFPSLSGPRSPTLSPCSHAHAETNSTSVDVL